MAMMSLLLIRKKKRGKSNMRWTCLIGLLVGNHCNDIGSVTGVRDDRRTGIGSPLCMMHLVDVQGAMVKLSSLLIMEFCTIWFEMMLSTSRTTKLDASLFFFSWSNLITISRTNGQRKGAYVTRKQDQFWDRASLSI